MAVSSKSIKARIKACYLSSNDFMRERERERERDQSVGLAQQRGE
jgi:hypothetical protein